MHLGGKERKEKPIKLKLLNEISSLTASLKEYELKDPRGYISLILSSLADEDVESLSHDRDLLKKVIEDEKIRLENSRKEQVAIEEIENKQKKALKLQLNAQKIEKEEIKRSQISLLKRAEEAYSYLDSEPEKILLIELVKKYRLFYEGEGAFSGSLQLDVQAVIGRYRVDFLFNKHFALEVDGKAYHANSDSFYKDKKRDQQLEILGYRVIRFTASQIMYEKETVSKYIEGVILNKVLIR